MSRRQYKGSNNADLFRPTTLNIGCGLDWNQDAINIDIEKTGVEDIILDISEDWEKLVGFMRPKDLEPFI